MIPAWLDSWVLMALVAAAAWALSCVIDVCFVGNGVYRRASDGPAIAGVFCLVPALTSMFALDPTELTVSVVLVGLLSGIAYLLHAYFYFKALFAVNDAVNAEIFNTLAILIVPLMAFVFLGERLAWQNYVAIAIAASGIVVLVGLQVARLPAIAIGYLIAAVCSISLVMVLQAWILQSASYASAVWIFSSAAFVITMLVFGLPRRRRRRVIGLCRRFGGVFIFVQLLEMAAVFGSQRATDLGPSVSLVALLECALPLFVMLFSWAIAMTARQWRASRWQQLRAALALQTVAARSKFASLLLIAMAILLVQVNGTF